VKRAFDVVVSALVVAVASPLWLLVVLLIKMDTKGPVLHRALRVGRGGREFTLFKFRTMQADARATGPIITRRDDPRITRVGRVLRWAKIDEMPQLINVLKGDMSIVGPRPEDPRYVAEYTREQRRVLTVRPGMASPAFIAYRHEEEMLAGQDDPEEILRSVPRGLYAVNFGGGQVDITSGKFVFSASEAYLIEDGKVTRPVKGATLIGNGPDALTRVSRVGHDLKMDEGIGTCGKDGQSVPVGVGLPTIRIDRMTVGGTQV